MSPRLHLTDQMDICNSSRRSGRLKHRMKASWSSSAAGFQASSLSSPKTGGHSNVSDKLHEVAIFQPQDYLFAARLPAFSRSSFRGSRGGQVAFGRWRLKCALGRNHSVPCATSGQRPMHVQLRYSTSSCKPAMI